MIEAVKQGKAEASEFAGVLGRVVPLAAQMGISFEEVAANLATFTRLGVSADEAATGLRQVMASLLKPTEDQEEAMQELGFTAEGLRKQIREEGLLRTLDAMTKATGGNEAAVSRLFPNIRALTSVLGTAGVQMDAYTDILGATENATGNLEEGFGIVADTAKFKMGVAMNELNLMLMELGEEILPALVPAMRAVVFAAQTLAEAMQPLVVTIGLISSAFEGFSKEELFTQRLQDMAANAEITKDEFIKLAEEGIGLTALEARKLADDTSFPTQMEIWRQKAIAFGMSGEEFDRRWEEAGVGFGRTAGEIRGEIDRFRRRADEMAAGAAAAAGGVRTLEDAIDDLRASIAAVSGAQQDNLSMLSSLTGARTQEQVAIELQANALKQELTAAEQAAVGQDQFGGSVSSTTDALGRQVGALQNLAASMVSQALNNEVIALERELKVLQLGKLEIEAQVNARNRLAQAMLAMANVASLPQLLALKKLELRREKLLAAQSGKTTALENEKAKILAKVGGKTADLADEDKARIAVIDKLLKKQKAAVQAIDDEMEALNRAIRIRTLEAEVINLQAEASDKNREAMQRELNEITDQIGATEDLKRQRELYIGTLVPVELLQEIDALERQKGKLDNVGTAAATAGGAVRDFTDDLRAQIGKLGLEREAIDLVTEGWKLQAEAMLDLPTIKDIGAGLQQFKELLIIQLQAQAAQLDPLADAAKWRAIMDQLERVLAFKPTQFHSGAFNIPRDMLAQLQAGEMVLPRRQAEVVRDLIRVPAAPLAAAAGTGPSVIERHIEVNVTDGSPAAIANAVKMADIELGLQTESELEGLS
jgi:hypothetical protein